MDPKNPPGHSVRCTVISGGCNRLRTYPYFRRKTELLRVVTPQPACPQAAPGHHDHPQLGSSTTTEGEVKALPCSTHLVRHGGLLVAPRRQLAGSTAPYDVVTRSVISGTVRRCSSCPGVINQVNGVCEWARQSSIRPGRPVLQGRTGA